MTGGERLGYIPGFGRRDVIGPGFDARPPSPDMGYQVLEKGPCTLNTETNNGSVANLIMDWEPFLTDALGRRSFLAEAASKSKVESTKTKLRNGSGANLVMHRMPTW